MPSSSTSSRISAASGVSPGCTLPPGNSQSPARCLPAGRSASSTRPSVSISATAATRTIGRAASASIATIDIDIAVGQIAGPHRRPAASDTDVDNDADIAAFHMLGDRTLVIPGHRAALLRDLDAADRDRQAVAVGLLAGLADRHDDAAPIRIARGERGLDQRRIADREADAPRRPVALGAGHLDGYKFFGPFAVARELGREINRQAGEGATEIVEKRVLGAGDRRVPRLLRRA